ncbi:hypothetical protein IFM89_006676 [Coptis chinensis]|uniref:Flap endonuclease GEN-like 2 n=1 Tax=Coptis chinensis TaxID=261450 RepID=A0A835MEB9_9MAGN|nr:hypothetical protein IFM89_006676 [Coptis chinensis]
MGVKNLWDILESCKKTLPLHHLQNKRVCIDLSCWIVQLQNVCKSHSSIKDKVYLRSLFHRLRALLALNCTLVLVADGSIPAIKLSTYRRRLGSGSEETTLLRQATRDEKKSQKLSLPRNMGSEFSCMIKEAKVLGMALGIPCLDSIEEAEAQCALLNSESLCDGCFTADSDVFLFGAKTIYRDIDLGKRGMVVTVVCYEMVDIERKLGFGRNSLITLALLLGSDYSHGVHGFGRYETACQIVRSLGDHNVLRQVASEGFAFVKKTKGLKKQGEVRNCDANKENSLGYRQKNIDEKDMQKDHQFIKGFLFIIHFGGLNFKSCAVNSLVGLLKRQPTSVTKKTTNYACVYLVGVIYNCFWGADEYILPKISERDLRRFAILRSTSSEFGVQLPLQEIPVTCPISAIIKRRIVQGSKCFEVAWKEYDGLKSSVVPADLIECACPEKIVEFEEKTQGKKKSLKPKTKKPQKTAALDEIDLKLKGLLIDIESENNAVSGSTPCRGAHTQLPIGKALPEVIDILSPLPCKTWKLQKTIDPLVDVIYVSESETDTSPEYARKARELRLFIASIKTDVS